MSKDSPRGIGENLKAIWGQGPVKIREKLIPEMSQHKMACLTDDIKCRVVIFIC